jgi:hypothetical protein
MPTEICGILLALVATHRTDWTDLSTAWLTPKTDSRGLSPDKAEIARTYPQANREWAPLFDSKVRLPPPADCGADFRRAGRKLAPWPKSVGAPRAGDTSPDRTPAILFGPVRVSTDSRFALVSWLQYWAPEASSFQYAVLEREGGGWRVVATRNFGPIS